MATVAPTITDLGQSNNKQKGCHLIVWTPLNSTNTSGDPVGIEYGADRTVAITGTFNTGTVTIQGSLDGTNYFTLMDMQGTAISKTAAALEGIIEFVRYIKPVIATPGTDSITVTLMTRNPNV